MGAFMPIKSQPEIYHDLLVLLTNKSAKQSLSLLNANKTISNLFRDCICCLLNWQDKYKYKF